MIERWDKLKFMYDFKIHKRMYENIVIVIY